MKTAREIISSLFDDQFVKKAQGYSKLFDSWKEITAKNGIAAAADHSLIKDLDKGILLVEMDHPGWKQILQTKQSKLLNDFRIRFPELDISGISLILGNRGLSGETQAEEAAVKAEKILYEYPQEKKQERKKSIESASAGLDAIDDDDFKAKLKQLGQTIANMEN